MIIIEEHKHGRCIETAHEANQLFERQQRSSKGLKRKIRLGSKDTRSPAARFRGIWASLISSDEFEGPKASCYAGRLTYCNTRARSGDAQPLAGRYWVQKIQSV